MSGIIGSKFNHRGSGLVGSLGTDGQHLLSSGAGKKHVFETVAAAAAYDDEPIKSDITALALREATNESSAAFNLPSSFIETFTDDTNLGTETQVGVYEGSISPQVTALSGTATELDYFTPTQADGGTTPYQAWGNSTIDAGGDTWTDIDVNETGPTKYVDAATALLSASGYFFRWTPPGSTKFMTVDYKENKLFSTKMKIGKNNGWGDTDQFKVEYSTDNASWSNVDFSSSSEVSYERGPASSGTSTGGGLSGTPSSSGTFNIAKHSGSTSGHYTGVLTLDGIPDFTARYLKVSYLSKHSGTPDNNLRNGILTPWGKFLSTTYYATGTLIQSANAVTGSRTKVGGTMLYKDNEGTATLGSANDLAIYFTCNGGTNWTEAAGYTAITPVYSTGIKQVRLSETTCTGGTDVRYKAVWANQSEGSKETQLHGIGINY